MTDLPYTDNDLRTEAARLLASAARDADDRIRPAVQRKWGEQATPEVIDEACDELVSLLDRAADVSEWAVNLGADGLEPLDSLLSMQTNSGPLCRIHFAVRPDMPEEMRRALVEGVAMEIAKYLPQTD
ncbi:hypothetical protein [Streptomyces bobili]|uniref:hypothetical protein n=1 Tax=Streptomyces bobili TaxID=67280 RepID=UPI0037AFC823